MVRCTRCSGSVSPGARACPHCGADFHQIPTETEPTTTLPLPAEPPAFQAGAGFSGRYTIIEKAGEGGMGIVYKATDRSLRQLVALKLIRRDLAQHPAFVERFKREVRVTRRITHPAVCRVHDLGEVDGIVYLSMQWIDGETLRQLLRQTTQLSQTRALEIASRIAGALAAAHAQGIVHRDLKPENVMIDSHGDVFVMDFGLATEGGASRGSRISRVVGTPPYSAPEQERGEAVDARSDLWALGLILQEMLTGQSPGPDRLSPFDSRTGISGRVAPLLDSLLIKEREKRFASAEDLERRLRKLGKTSRPAEYMARLGRWSAHQARRPLVWAGAAAVLIASLWILRPAPVVEASEATRFHERGLHYLREGAGSLASNDNAILMFNRSLERDSGYTPALAGLAEAYWNRYDKTKDPIFRTEAMAAMQKAMLIDASLPEVRLARARGLIGDGDYRAAKKELERLLEERPDLDMAWVFLGRAHRELREYSAGIAALENAVKLQPRNSHHQTALGAFFQRFNEYKEAEKAYLRAIELKPDNALALSNLGAVYLHTGHPEDAAKALGRSLAIEENAEARTNLGTAHFFLGQYEEAATHYRGATRTAPSNEVYWGNLGDALAALGRREEAAQAYREAVRLGREEAGRTKAPAVHLQLALWCARIRDTECALAEGTLASERQPDDAQVLFRNAIVRAIIGRTDEALSLLEKAVRLGLGRVEIEQDPDLEPVRADPRYERLIRLAS